MTRLGRPARLLLLAALVPLAVAVAPTAQAAPSDTTPNNCTPDWVKVIVENKTELDLSVFVLSTDWCDAPAGGIRARGTDTFRAGSGEFGAPVAFVGYRVEGGGVLSTSARIRNGQLETECSYDSPVQPAAYRCRTESTPSKDAKAVVRFVLEPVGR